MHKYFILFVFIIIQTYNSEAQLRNIFSSKNENTHSLNRLNTGYQIAGKLSQLDSLIYQIELSDDNDNPELPIKYRNWYYQRLNNVNTEDTITIRIKHCGWPASFMLPVYSYDGRNWQRFDIEDIHSAKSTKEGGRYFFNYEIKKQFSQPYIYVSRYYPYAYKDLISFLSKYEYDKRLQVTTIGHTPQNKPILKLTITNPYQLKNKKHIWIHSRTHPSETPTSFIIEGIVDELLDNHHNQNLSDIVVHIVPMLNIDGVGANNSRLSPSGYDIERQWLRLDTDSSMLSDLSASEVKILHQTIKSISDAGGEFIMALNLHATNSAPGARNFIFSNFSPIGDTFGDEEKIIWLKQAKFVRFINDNYCDSVYAFSNRHIKTNLLDKPYPESWWWANFKSKVMAVTVEATFNSHSCSDGYATPADHIKFGRAIARAIMMYSERDGMYVLPDEFEIEALRGFWKHLQLEHK